MIEAGGLTKRYGDSVAVDDLSFSVRPGIVTGFLGPNGSGKSTTMRLILGLDAPTAGDVTVNGQAYREHPAPLHEVGALLEAKAVHSGRSAYNHLLCLAQTHGIPRAPGRRVIELVGLTRRAGSGPASSRSAWGSDSASRPRCSATRTAAARRAGQRARPRGHPVDPRFADDLAAGAGRCSSPPT